MVVKKEVKDIQTAGYNGARTVNRKIHTRSSDNFLLVYIPQEQSEF